MRARNYARNRPGAVLRSQRAPRTHVVHRSQAGKFLGSTNDIMNETKVMCSESETSVDRRLPLRWVLCPLSLRQLRRGGHQRQKRSQS